MDCLFCKIANKEIDSRIVYENEQLIAFHDINPHAPTHILIIPRQHIATINDIQLKDSELLGNLVHCAKHIALDRGIDKSGYRLVFNVNRDAGQEVFHIHLHLIGGRKLQWPPG